MVLVRDSGIKEVMKERVLTAIKYGQPTRGFIDKLQVLHSHVHNILNASAESPLPNLDVNDLRALREDIEKKHTVAYNQVTTWLRQLEAIRDDKNDLSESIGDKAVLLKQEELKKQLLVKKKRLEELQRNKNDINEINEQINRFTRSHKSLAAITLTEEELEETFGDRKEAVLRSSSVTKIRRPVEMKNDTKDEKKDEDVEMKESGDAEEGDDKKKEPETVIRYVPVYQITASLGKSVPELRRVQQDLEKRLNKYEEEIQELRNAYIDNLNKFEAIKRIVGLVEEKKEEESTEMGDEQEHIQDEEDEAEVDESDHHHHEEDEDDEGIGAISEESTDGEDDQEDDGDATRLESPEHVEATTERLETAGTEKDEDEDTVMLES